MKTMRDIWTFDTEHYSTSSTEETTKGTTFVPDHTLPVEKDFQDLSHKNQTTINPCSSQQAIATLSSCERYKREGVFCETELSHPMI